MRTPHTRSPLAVALGFFLVAGLPYHAFAYVGPGAGLSALGTVLALVGAFLLLIVGFVWFPLKRLLRSRREARRGDATGTTEQKGK